MKRLEKLLGLKSYEDNQPEEVIEFIEDEELVAIITAAIAASLGKSALDFRVVSFKKRGDWNKQAYL
jgi:hypothetical protein